MTRASVRRTGPAEQPWEVYLPTVGAECFEGGNEVDGAQLAPYGATYWETHADAVAFADRIAAATPAELLEPWGVLA